MAVSPTSTPEFGRVGWGGVLASKFSLGFLTTRHRETWVSAHTVTKTDYTQTNEQI